MFTLSLKNDPLFWCFKRDKIFIHTHICICVIQNTSRTHTIVYTRTLRMFFYVFIRNSSKLFSQDITLKKIQFYNNVYTCTCQTKNIEWMF